MTIPSTGVEAGINEMVFSGNVSDDEFDSSEGGGKEQALDNKATDNDIAIDNIFLCFCIVVILLIITNQYGCWELIKCNSGFNIANSHI